jgi:hypothetical protein
MLGCFLETFMMTPGGRDRARKYLFDFAARLGYAMPAIFMEPFDARPPTIESLIQAVRREGAAAVAVIGADSLAEHHRHELEDAGVELLIAADPP